MPLLPSFLRGRSLTTRIVLVGTTAGFVVLSFVSAFYIAVRTPVDVAGSLAESTAKAVREAFNFTPRISIDQVVVFEQNSPIMELATVERELYTQYTWKHSWLGSTKEITVRGVFVAKAGFDLRKPFHIDISRNPLSVRTQVPPAELLSLEMKEYKLVTDNDGWWNKVTPQDRQHAVRALMRSAREKANTSGIRDEAERSVQERLRDIVSRNETALAAMN